MQAPIRFVGQICLVFGLMAVGVAIADEILPLPVPVIGAGEEVTSTDTTKNCREYNQRCRTEALNTCFQVQGGDVACDGCSFTASGYKLDQTRAVGFCASPEPLEAVVGCPKISPTIQCARVLCYKVITIDAGVTTCNDNSDRCWRIVNWTTQNVDYWCIP